MEAIQLFGSRNVIENTISIARKREAQFAATISAKLMPFDMLLYSFPIDGQDLQKLLIKMEKDIEHHYF